MNLTEYEIRKEYRYSNLSYVFDVYMECEFRANLTDKEYDGLQPGEFRFDYESWMRRLQISKKQLVRAIKELTTKNIVIIQVLKGKRGTSSKYFLARFKEQKKEQNEELNRNLIGTEKGVENTGLSKCLGTEKGTQKEQNEEQKKVQSSQYNNLNIVSNKEKGSTSLDMLIAEYTQNECLRETLKDFLKMRKAIKKTMTDRALKIMLKKLKVFSNDEDIQIKILEQSILNSWQGIFPLKDQSEKNTVNHGTSNIEDMF